jgi:hypothetical protein
MTACNSRPEAVIAKHPVRPIRSSVCTIRQPGRDPIARALAKLSGRDPQETLGELTLQAVAPLVEKPSVARRVALEAPRFRGHVVVR